MIQGLIAILMLSVIDYIGYNNWGHLYTNQYFNTYRIFIVVIQIFISIILFLFFSIVSVIVFLWLWWIGLSDFLYYVIDKLNGNTEQFFMWKNEVTLSWLWFTPIGLFKKLILKKDITKKEFLIQVLIGSLITLIII